MVSTRVKNKAIQDLILCRSIAHVEITNVLIPGQRVPIYMKKMNATGTQSLMFNPIDTHIQNMDMPYTLK